MYIYIRLVGLSINILYYYCCLKYNYYILGNVYFFFYSFNIDKYLGRVFIYVRNLKFVNL